MEEYSRKRVTNKEIEPIRVKMFGKFQATYKGQSLIGSKTAESQFAYLLQLLFHAGSEGVPKHTIEQVLFQGKDLENVHHAMQSVIYNSKKKLSKFAKDNGLPDVNFIVRKKDIFYWTDEIPILVDALEFEEIYHETEQYISDGGIDDPILSDKVLAKYLEAIYLYTGGFLEVQTGTYWAAREERRYLAMFCDMVESAAELLRKKSDYIGMEDIGIHASRVHPLSDWEVLIMEAMASMGRYDDARKLYENTVEYYMEEQGLRPSDTMMEMLNRLGAQMEHQYEVLDNIQAKLTEPEERRPGGYECSYPVFLGCYQIFERTMERGGNSVFLMLCTIVDSKGNPMRYGAMLDELSERLDEAIHLSTRKSDVICRYGKGQYLVLLSNTTMENCKVVQKRINEHFITKRQRTGVEYHVNSVFCEKVPVSNPDFNGKA